MQIPKVYIFLQFIAAFRLKLCFHSVKGNLYATFFHIFVKLIMRRVKSTGHMTNTKTFNVGRQRLLHLSYHIKIIVFKYPVVALYIADCSV